MTALVRIAAHLRAVLAAHVALKFVDRRGLRPAHDVERDSLMRVAAKAPDFKIEIARIEGITERRRRLRLSFVPDHPLIPRLASKAVGLFACLPGSFGRRPDRTAVNRLA